MSKLIEKQNAPAETDKVDQSALIEALERILRKPAPKPRELGRCGTGALYSEQQYCYDKGWREAIAAYRKMLRAL
jgi:hypothetical protein